MEVTSNVRTLFGDGPMNIGEVLMNEIGSLGIERIRKTVLGDVDW